MIEFQLFLATYAAWANRHQSRVIAYLFEENLARNVCDCETGFLCRKKFLILDRDAVFGVPSVGQSFHGESHHPVHATARSDDPPV